MNLQSTFAVPAQVMTRQVGAETVVLDLASGTYFGLDPVGARVWQLVEQGKSLAEVCDVMIDEYDVARGELERDTLALAAELAEKKLVTVQ